MKYALFIWEEKKWRILHYSHRHDDAEKWYKYYHEIYGDRVEFFVEIHEKKNQEAANKLRELLRKIKDGE